MFRKDFFKEQDRLPARLAATLRPELQDAIGHPVRREILRALNQSGRPRDLVEIGGDLQGLRVGQLSYHLQVLQRSGAVASEPPCAELRSRASYASAVCDDGQVRAILRATEQGDRERRDAAVAADASPLLTMFRVPRPVRTLRLRSRSRVDAERDR